MDAGNDPDRPGGRVTVTFLVGAHRPGTSGGDRYNARLIAAGDDAGYDLQVVHRRWYPRLPDADVVVVDSLEAWKTGLPLRRRPRPPTVALVHQVPGGVDGRRPVRRIRAILDVLAYRACDVLVTTGSVVTDDLRRRGLPGIEQIEPGCDLPAGRARPPLRGSRRLGLLLVGHWLPNKGIVDAVEALSRLPADVATLHLVGRTDLDAAYTAAVRQRIGAHALEDRVTIHGPLDPEHVAALCAAADGFVFPSRVEAYGTVVAEALAAGLPVIGWRAPHLAALVDDGVEGLLVEPGDVDALGRAIARVACDDALRGRLAAGARRRGCSLPRWCATTRRFVAVVRRLVPEPVEPPDDGSASDDVDPADRGVLDEEPAGQRHVGTERPTDRGLDRADVGDDDDHR